MYRASRAKQSLGLKSPALPALLSSSSFPRPRLKEEHVLRSGVPACCRAARWVLGLRCRARCSVQKQRGGLVGDVEGEEAAWGGTFFFLCASARFYSFAFLRRRSVLPRSSPALLCLCKPSGHHPSATLDPGSTFKGSMLRSLQCLLAYRVGSLPLRSWGHRLATTAHARSVPWRRAELPVLIG